jgi:transposase-like protein
MDYENRPIPLPEDYREEDHHIPDIFCPHCESSNVRWKGGDNIVNLGNRPTFTRVDWWTCQDCGHKWTESYDHE